MSAGDSKSNGSQQYLVNTILYGQTCDGHDELMSGIPFPEVNIGDIIKFNELGAYSDSLGGNFNGYDLPYHVYYVSVAAEVEMMSLRRWPRLSAFFNRSIVYYEHSINSVQLNEIINYN